ncbi:hypothetical protein N865_13395 [Intrasporangium oryzae NRRL B-24470]|uniref:EfeO-type cupredoxin-like domain-containing protein n=1 Tax=Intrasporangium oryzae NRRL B-24470 TaxID=1386089 RepID=W9GAB7_9MICO|nr:hypothetical protein [Intrasporangium oryzae]EWT00824.1 hypothetical protein N865_13395 [Intrasporangium oryzae NRRL B-24470]
MRLLRVLPYAACLLALSGAAACGAGDTPSGPGAGGAVSSTGGAGTTAASRRLEVTISGTTVTPAPAQVELGIGQTLELVVTSDHDDELHVHGFEVEAPLKAGTPTTVRLTGTTAGLYEVETHDPALTLLTVAVR